TYFPTTAIDSVSLAPGMHTVASGNGLGGSVKFFVAADGTVDYDQSLDGVLSGRYTTTLRVKGVTIQLDATALALPAFLVDLQVPGPPAPPSPWPVLRGLQSRVDAYHYNNYQYSPITPEAPVRYDLALEGLFAGQGTKILPVRGLAVTVDTTRLSE